MYHVQSGLLDARSLIPVTQQSIRRSHCSGPLRCFLTMLMDWAIYQMRSLTLSSLHCAVKPPLSCQIPMVSAAHCLTPAPAFSAQMRTFSWYMDCISICDDWFRQPEGITFHCRFSTVVNDWVVDIECVLLQTRGGIVEYIVNSDAMQK